MAKYTPGPWPEHFVSEHEACGCCTYPFENPADVVLMQAAPDMADALQATIEYLTVNNMPVPDVVRDALTKAGYYEKD